MGYWDFDKIWAKNVGLIHFRLEPYLTVFLVWGFIWLLSLEIFACTSLVIDFQQTILERPAIEYLRGCR